MIKEYTMQDIDELEDFDIPPVSYEVWVLGYDRFDRLTPFEYLVGSFNNPDAAVDRARALAALDLEKEIPDEISYFSIEVETIADGLNAGTIYRRHLENTKPTVDLWIDETDYELTEEGNLKITGSKIKSFKTGYYINISISGRPEAEPILLKVIYKEDTFIICEFID
jgi:hypothetical protein